MSGDKQRKLISFLESNNILHSNQHGFRSGLSTVTQLVETLHDLSFGINERIQTDVIFLDFSKAFDRVSHTKLLLKLNHLLGDGPIFQWITNYLTDRHQYVQYGNHTSDLAPVLSGVPQGSVLAPVLFLIYINDITNYADVKLRLFADDCVLYNEIRHHDDQVKLSNSLNKIAQWCADWQMTINIDKTVFMSITNKVSKFNFQYHLNNVPLRKVYQYKYLGITIASDLSWTEHVRQVSKKAMSKLFFIKRALSFATHETKLLAYVTFVRPVLEYASIVWFPHTANNIAILERVQRKAVRFIFNRYGRNDSPTALLHRAGLATLDSRAKVFRLKFLYLLLHRSFRINPDLYLNFRDTRPTRRRHPWELEEYSFSNNTFSYSFFPRAIREWNTLDAVITQQPTLEKFMKLIEGAVLS